MESVDQLDGVLPVNQARSRDARDRLLHAGERVFAKVGYDAAHVNDIAAAAGCSVGSFYRRFRDKEAFFKALHHRFTERNLENAARFFAMEDWQNQPTSVMRAHADREHGAHHEAKSRIFSRAVPTLACRRGRRLLAEDACGHAAAGRAAGKIPHSTRRRRARGSRRGLHLCVALGRRRAGPSPAQ